MSKISKEEFKNLVIQTKKKEKENKIKTDRIWVNKVIIIAFIVSFCMSYASNQVVPNINIPLGIILTLLFVLLGILFDIVGVAVTSADEAVFHSMNSRKVKGANVAVILKKNASKVSSFCCDVIGDICGIVSGAAATAISVSIAANYNFDFMLTGLITAGIISSLTIGGKAMGKSFAINKGNIILYEFAKFISIFYKKKN
ncbi:MAG: hypothetical protein IJH20_00305 [Bacilli bacterium]|nr:hypothetical protein [Bacilli bacterium]